MYRNKAANGSCIGDVAAMVFHLPNLAVVLFLCVNIKKKSPIIGYEPILSLFTFKPSEVYVRLTI
jgi:hypothetical protein